MQLKRTKYVAEFKSEAVKQVIDKGHAVVDVAKRLGIPEGILYGWVNKFKKSEQPQSSDLKTLQAEMVKLKAELRRTTKESDIESPGGDSQIKVYLFHGSMMLDGTVFQGANSHRSWTFAEFP
jgi:transposase